MGTNNFKSGDSWFVHARISKSLQVKRVSSIRSIFISQGLSRAASPFESCGLSGCWFVGLLILVIDLMVCWLVVFSCFGCCFA